MATLFINKSKVHSIYIRYTFYKFEQVMLHQNLRLFTFAEVLAWIKERILDSSELWMIKEVDWGPIYDFSKTSPTPPRRFWAKSPVQLKSC